jgi:hypothetical protein
MYIDVSTMSYWDWLPKEIQKEILLFKDGQEARDERTERLQRIERLYYNDFGSGVGNTQTRQRNYDPYRRPKVVIEQYNPCEELLLLVQ